MANLLRLTDTAINQLRTIVARHQNPNLALRVYVTPGGCSGFSYGMALDDEPSEDDQIVEADGVRVLVDPFSAAYLQGAEIDFVDALMGGGFTVRNPNAVRSCACGQSFETAAGGGAAKPCH
jgi:iron-sulfur cluster assembly protein